MRDHIFRAYDIRGIVGQDFDKNDARLIGMAYATYLKKDKKLPLKVVVGRDGRVHSPEIHKAFMLGVCECGVDVYDIGLSASPLMNFSVCYGDFDGGVNITASHNPKDYNGFKLQKKHAHSIFGEQIAEIAEIVKNEDFSKEDKKGEIIEADFVQEWYQKISELVQIKLKPKVVVDAGNGVMGAFVEDFFTKIGVDIVPLYCEVDGNFPNHEANPEEEENLYDLKQKIAEENADLGIAFDGDGDRVGVVDKNGVHYSADLLLILLARDLLSRHKGAKIVYDLKATKVLDDEVRKLGGVAIPCKTGHSFIEGKMTEEKALLGGEVSGHLFFAEDYYGFDDALLGACKLIQIIADSGKTPTELLTDLPKTYVTPEMKVKIKESHKFDVMDRIIAHFTEKYPEKFLTIDGVKIDHDDGSWGIVRASNTSAYLTLRFEARSTERLEEIKNEFLDHLKTYQEISF